MKKLNNKKNIYINRLKERYLYIILLTIVMVFLVIFISKMYLLIWLKVAN